MFQGWVGMKGVCGRKVTRGVRAQGCKSRGVRKQGHKGCKGTREGEN